MTKKQNEIQMPEMYSKAGRFTQEKYIVFQRQKELSTENNQGKSKTQYQPEKERPQLKPEFQAAQKKNSQSQNAKKAEPKSSQRQPFKKIISREEAQQLRMIKNPPPPCGHYHPKFNEIDSKVHFSNIFYDVQKSESRKQVEELGDFEKEKVVLPEKSPSKVYGRVQFQHYTDRKKYWCPIDPHDRRFETIPDTFYSTRLSRPSNVLFKQNYGREDFEHLHKKNSCPDYNKNYDMILQKTILMVPELKKTTPRNNQDKLSYCVNENFFDYGQYTQRSTSQVFNKIKDVKMDGQVGRYTNPKSHFPSFMQKNMTNRQCLNQINQKMLETNYFADAKFQTVQTSFKTYENLQTKQDTDIDKTLQSLYSIE